MPKPFESKNCLKPPLGVTQQRQLPAIQIVCKSKGVLFMATGRNHVSRDEELDTARLLVHRYNKTPALVEALNDLMYNLEESKSTSDTLAALDLCIPDLRAALNAMDTVDVDVDEHDIK